MLDGGGKLHAGATLLKLRLLDSQIDHVQLALQQIATVAEHDAFARHHRRRHRIVLGHVGRKRNLGRTRQFRPIPRRERPIGQQLRTMHVIGRPRLRIVQPQQHLALLDHAALADFQFGDDAAFPVLHGFAVALHNQRPRSQDRAIQRRQRAPGTDAEKEHNNGCNTQPDRVFHNRPPAATSAGVCCDMNSDARCTPVICPLETVAT